MALTVLVTCSYHRPTETPSTVDVASTQKKLMPSYCHHQDIYCRVASLTPLKRPSRTVPQPQRLERENQTLYQTLNINMDVISLINTYLGFWGWPVRIKLKTGCCWICASIFQVAPSAFSPADWSISNKRRADLCWKPSSPMRSSGNDIWKTSKCKPGT